MSYQIRYRDKWTGEQHTHVCKLSEGEARGWATDLARDNGCKAVCEHVADGPYDRSGRVTHIVTEGSDQ